MVQNLKGNVSHIQWATRTLVFNLFLSLTTLDHEQEIKNLLAKFANGVQERNYYIFKAYCCCNFKECILNVNNGLNMKDGA